MAATASQRLGLQVCAALGVDPAKVRAIHIDIPVGDLPTVTFETLLIDPSAEDGVMRGIERYHLVEIDPSSEA